MAGPIPGAQAVSQFGAFLGACGEAAVAMVEHVYTPASQLSTDTVDSLVRSLQAQGHPDAGSATNRGELVQLLSQAGLPAQETSTQDTLAAAAQGLPAILLVDKGGNLPGHTDTGLQGHFVSILGADPAGYFVADSDTAAGQAGQLIHETPAQIAAANPIGGITIDQLPQAQGVNQFAWQKVSGALGTLSAPARLAANVNNLIAGMLSPDFGWRVLLIVFGLGIAWIGFLVFVQPAERQTIEIAGKAAAFA